MRTTKGRCRECRQQAISNLSPLRRARAQAVLSALALWITFTLSPEHVEDLAAQAGMTSEQAEIALDDLATLGLVELSVKRNRVFVCRANKEGNAA